MFGSDVENDLATAENNNTKNRAFANRARRQVLASYGIIDASKGIYRDPAKDIGKKPDGTIEEDIGD